MKEISVFEFEKAKIRCIIIDGELWWVAADVCRVIGVSNSRDAVSQLDDDEKDDVGITDAIGRLQNTTVINEPGLYSLILRSRKPEAKKFKRWVTHDVLPTIRKTGKYEIGNDWKKVRAKSKEIRLRFTDTLKDHGCYLPFHYAKITSDQRKAAQIEYGKKKDNFSKEELLLTMTMENMAEYMIEKKKTQTFEETRPVANFAFDKIAQVAEIQELADN